MLSNFKQLSALENRKEKVVSKYPTEKLNEVGFRRIVVNLILFEQEDFKHFFFLQTTCKFYNLFSTSLIIILPQHNNKNHKFTFFQWLHVLGPAFTSVGVILKWSLIFGWGFCLSLFSLEECSVFDAFILPRSNSCKYCHMPKFLNEFNIYQQIIFFSTPPVHCLKPLPK